MQILAIDVGMGTQDTLLFDSDKKLENNIKLVSPSQTRILADRVINSKDNIVFTGGTMGGGPISSAITKHIKKGFKVVMTKDSARTIDDNLKNVAELGIEIIDEGEVSDFKDYEHIVTRDVNFDFLTTVLEKFRVLQDIDYIGIAVQDHGYCEGKSDRQFRFERIKEVLEKGGTLKDSAYADPPNYLTRMTSVVKDAKKYFENVLTVDTKIAAIAGAIHGINERPIISVDVGNGHTLGAVMEGGRIGMFEHHTHLLTANKLEEMLIKLADGKLTNEEVFEDGGHGCCVRGRVGMENISKVLVTGPHRDLLKGSKLKVEFANPAGDVMMTGPAGIVDIIMENFI
ncbi:MAG: DUF1786 domain-containing protein [Candidatus Hydrothermarchaeales archaeon]